MSLPERSSRAAVHAAILAALVALVAFIAWRAMDIQPFDGDNLWILAWADRTKASDLPAVEPGVFPEWRPLSYATIWLQYQSATIEHLWSYQLVNVSIWLACGWLIARIVIELSGSALAGIAAAVIALTSTQLVSSFALIVERQSSMACLFGLAAWLVSIRAWNETAPAGRWVVVSILLAASAFCKEYGLSFTAALGALGIFDRRWAPLRAAAGAAAFYVVCRIAFAHGALALYCEQHGYFSITRNVCFDRPDTAVISQAIYNVIATGIGTLLPGLFFEDGTISVSPRWLVMSGALLAIAVVGWVRGPRLNRAGLLIVVFNSILSVLLYRSRNQVIAVCALGVAAGVGLPIVWSMLKRTGFSQMVQVGALAVLIALLGTRALVMRRLVTDRVEMSKRPDACGPDIPDLDRAFMERVWRLYNLALPECAGVETIR